MNGFKAYGSRVMKANDEVVISAVALERAAGAAKELIDESKMGNLVNFVNNLLSPSRNPPLQILFEDEDIAVVLKPAGVHSLKWIGTMKKNFFCLDHTLPLILTPSTRDVLPRPLPCHRLDSRVSGCLICAKSQPAQADIARQFQEHSVHKVYTAIVVGDFQPDAIEIDEEVDGLRSLTAVKVLSRTPCKIYGTLTKLQLIPKTGRRHQLRRHCAAAGFPILGDDLYHEAGGLENKCDRLNEISRAAANSSSSSSARKVRTKVTEQNLCIKSNFNSGNFETEEEWEEGGTSQCGMKNKKQVPVRRGRGLFLMSTAVEFQHPRQRGQRVRVDCKLAPRFQRALDKARKGADVDTSRTS